MKKSILLLCSMLLILAGCKNKKIEKERLCSRIDLARILSLFPTTPEEIQELSKDATSSMNDVIKSLNDIKTEHRTFANTIRPYDRAKFEFIMNKNILSVMSLLSDNPELQLVSNTQFQLLKKYDEDVLKRNLVLQQAFSEYKDHGKDMTKKTVVTKYFLHKMLQKFKREGVELPVAQRSEIVGLTNHIDQLISQYKSNIEHDDRKIVVPVTGLKGVPASFVNSLRKDVRGNYIVPVDLKSYGMIMQHCQVERTRKEFYISFGQRAYPQNISLLQDIIELRQDYAAKLGYVDFAMYQIQPQMLQHPKKVEQFLWHLITELQKYEAMDYQEFMKDLPSSVTLTKDKKLKSWDYDFVMSWYRKKHFNIDNNMSQYFQVEQVLPKLLDLIHKLFHIDFEQQEIESHQLWAPGLSCYRVRSHKNQIIMGYLFVDLFKRDHKKVRTTTYMKLVPTIRDDCSIPCVGASILAANFTPSTEEKASLLNLDEVKTLFKQLGNAIHELFGSTCYADFSGTQLSHDFKQAPSRVLEFWLNDAKTLQSVSSHHKTGHKLSKDTIEQIAAARDFEHTHALLKDAFISLLSLSMYKDGQNKDIHKMIEKIYKKVFKHISYEPAYYFEYINDMVVTNGSLHYVDLWSKAVAADLYDHIEQSGLQSDIGKEYVKHILQPGGFAAPAIMTKRFLKRSLNPYALFKQLNKE